MIRLLLAAFLILAFAGTAHAQTPTYFVNDTTNVIEGYTEDSRVAAPAGTTAVLVSTIKAATTGKILQGGTWDGTAYAPPAGILDPNSVATRRLEIARLIAENWLPFVTPALTDEDMLKITTQLNALMRAITIDSNMSSDTNYATLLSEAEVSGGSFLRYAGNQWTGAGGYYSMDLPHSFPGVGAWRLFTIHEAINAGTATDGATAGAPQAGIVVDRSDIDSFNWPLEIYRLVSP